MNVIAITLLFAATLLMGLLLLVRKQGLQISQIRDIEANWQKVDLAAFLNLADPVEERYLQRNLSRSEFRRIQRERVLVMWEYLGRLSANAKLMMKAGQLLQHHSSGQQLQDATQMVANASRMRLLILAADAFLAVRFLLPETKDPISGLVRRYEFLAETFTQTCGQQLVMARSVAS